MSRLAATLYRIKIPSRLATVQELINDTVDLSTCIGIETLLIETPLVRFSLVNAVISQVGPILC